MRQLVTGIISLLILGIAAALNFSMIGRSDNVWINILNLVAFFVWVAAAYGVTKDLIKQADELDEIEQSHRNVHGHMVDAIEDLNNRLGETIVSDTVMFDNDNPLDDINMN